MPVRKTFLKKKNDQCADQLPDLVARINGLSGNWEERLPAWQAVRDSDVITVASDCSGYGSELIALRLLGLQKKCRCVMTSENDIQKAYLHRAVARCCGFDLENCKHVKDMFERQNHAMPRAQLYVAGYPCPSWSRLGKKGGLNDRRGQVTLKGLEFVAETRPRIVILEQVSAIMDKNHKKTWSFVLKTLKRLGYSTCFAKLNAKDYGSAQSRPRVYLQAICKESVVSGEALSMPEPRAEQPDLHTYLEKGLVGDEILSLPKYEEKLGKEMWSKGFILDVGSSSGWQHVMRNLCPCLTKSRLASAGFYIPKLKRRLLLTEAARLQGLPKQVVTAMSREAEKRKWPQHTVEGAIGDGMTINVVGLVIRRALRAAGWREAGASKDFWLHCPKDSCSCLNDRLFDKYGP